MNQTDLVEGPFETVATISGIPRIDGGSVRFQLRLPETNEIVQGSTFLTDERERERWRQIRPGYTCKFNGELEPPRAASNFFQFDYERYLYEQSVHWTYRVQANLDRCEMVLATWADRFNDWRMDRMEQIRERYHEDTAGLIIALTYGDRYFIDQDVLTAYQRLGVVHLLAVSGLHVGMLSASALFLLIRLGLTRERAMEVIMVILPFYAFAAGAAPPVIRAAAMSFVVLLCLRLKKRIPPLAGITLIFFIFLLLKPYVLFQLGFQLSFLVSFSLIVSAQAIRKLCKSYISQTMAVTLIAQLVTFPLIMYHFFEWSLISLPLNFIYIPFVTLIVLPASFLASLFDLALPSAVNLPYHLLQLVVPPIHQGLIQLNEFALLTYNPGRPSIWMIVMMYTCIMIVLLLWESQRKYWWLVSLFLMMVPIVWMEKKPYFQTSTIVTMIDIGQGDSFVIELPKREAVMIIDTGGVTRFGEEPWQKRREEFDPGKDILIPFLKAKGITTIDYLMLSHGDQDHIGGAQAIAEQMQVDKLLYGKGPIEKENEKQTLSAFAESGTEMMLVSKGMGWSHKGGHFKILSPDPLINEEDINERSIVMLAELNGVQWLFTGDLGESGEKRLIENYPTLRVDILKAGHHGSLSSTTEAFLDHLKPKAVLISAGRDNRYGHPHPDVVQRLDDRSIRYWRTDLEGAVELSSTDGEWFIRQALSNP